MSHTNFYCVLYILSLACVSLYFSLLLQVEGAQQLVLMGGAGAVVVDLAAAVNNSSAPAPAANAVANPARRKRKAPAEPGVLPASRRVRAASPTEEEQLVALFGAEDEEEGYDLDDTAELGSAAEDKGLAAALRSRYKKSAARGVAGGGVAKVAAAPSAPPKTLSPLSALFGFTQGKGGVGDADVTEFIDALPPSQLLVRGSLLCPHLQSANTLVTMLREKCLAPSPSFSSPQELSANVDRVVMLLMASASRSAREMGLTMSNEARNLFGSGRFKAMTKGDMVKLQRRVNMLILEDPDTAADTFTTLMRRAKLDKAFDKAWECQVDNDYLLGDDSPLQPAAAGGAYQQNGGGGNNGNKPNALSKKQKEAARVAKSLCYNCGHVGHMKRDCTNAPNEERVNTEKAKRASLKDK